MPRFVILEHHHQGVHWDFMLEAGNALRTWRLEWQPSLGPASPAKLLAHHRKAYLNFEGEISGGRGHVTRWDEGDFDWLEDGPDTVRVSLRGKRIAGRVYLRRSASGDWTFQLTSDESVARSTDSSV